MAGELTSTKMAAVFLAGYAPLAVRTKLPKKVFSDWLDAAIKLRMDQTILFAAGSTPAELLPGNAKAAALDLMSQVEHVGMKKRKVGQTGKSIQDAFVTVISEPSNTGKQLATALDLVYDF